MRKILSTGLMVLLMAVMGIAAAAEGVTLALPANLQVVSAEAFMGSAAIREVDIPAGTTAIESRAFSGCTALKKVTINSRDVRIADDAFDGCPNVNLYVYSGSTGEAYAIKKGIQYTLIDSADPVIMDIMDMVGRYSISGSGLQGGNNRFIVRMNGGSLPDLTDYHPVAIAEGGDGVFFIQFGEDDDSEIDANNCYAMLQGLVSTGEAAYVEPDAVTYVTNRGEDSGSVGAAGIMTWDDDDPMGFDDYSAYVAEHQSGSQVIAVVDTGVKKNAAYNSILYSRNFNVIPDGQDAFYSGRNHGSFIASIIHDCVGSANVKVMSVRAVDDNEETLPSIFGLAIEKAVEAGADIINISYILPYSKYVEDELRTAANKGVKIVVAAGNYNGSTADFFPANADIGSNKIVVSGLEDANRVWSRTNTGPQVTYCAPAAGIRTSYAAIGEGTSFAAPMIASACALVQLDTTHTLSDMKASCKTDIGLNGKANKSQALGNGMPQLAKLSAVAVSNIAVENAPTVLKVGDTAVLKYAVEPDNATNQTISYASSNESVLLLQAAGNGTWGDWSEWSTTRRTITDAEHMQENTKTQYLWYRYVCSNCGACMHTTGTCWTWAGGCGKTGTLTSDTMQTSLMSVAPSEGVQDWNGTGKIEYGDDTDDRWFYSSAIVSYRYRYKGTGANELVVSAVRRGSASITLSANDDSGVTRKLDIQVVQPVTSVKISGDTSTLKMTNTLPLSVSVLPAGADNKAVKWTSSNTSVAKVSSSGVVTPVSGGTVVIRAEAQDGYGAKDEFTLTIVEIPDPESIEIMAQSTVYGEDDTLELAPGDELRLTAAVYPEDAVQTVVWSAKSIPASANVVTIDSETGYLTAVNAGSAIITATSAEKGTVRQQVSVLVQVKSTGITISGASEVNVGETITLTATVIPANATNKNVVWRSSDPKKATVTQNGVVTGIKNGPVEIIAASEADSTVIGTKYITVKQLPESIDISGTVNLFINNDDPDHPAQNASPLTAVVSPADTYDPSVTWSSSNTGVATVDSDGIVTTVSEGTAVITATSVADSSVTATVTVAVKNKWGNWSEFSTTAYSSDDSTQVEEKLIYKYRELGNWSGWSEYSTNRESISDSRFKEEETRTVYFYYYYSCPHCGAHWPQYNNTCQVSGCGWTVKKNSETFFSNLTPFGECPYQQIMGVSRYILNSGDIYNRAFSWYTDNVHKSQVEYRYRTRAWTDWMESESPIEPSYIREVDTYSKYRKRVLNSF